MSFSTFSPLGMAKTPAVLRNLLLATVIISIISAALQTILERFGIGPGPQDLLSLSWYGLSSGYIWQPLSYFFIQESGPYGLSFFFLISLAFYMYVLWLLGSSLIEIVGKYAFLRFYLISGALAGLLTIMLVPLTGDFSRLAGSNAPIMAALTAWCMAYAEAEILLFFLIPVKAKWLVIGLLGAFLLIALSHWDLTYFLLYLSSVAIGYVYAAMVWGWRSPFHQTHDIDRRLATAGKRLRNYMPRRKSPQKDADNKIVDLHSGKAPADDDAFIDAMLAKISKYGESSLSWHEKRRMQQISERKMRQK